MNLVQRGKYIMNRFLLEYEYELYKRMMDDCEEKDNSQTIINYLKEEEYILYKDLFHYHSTKIRRKTPPLNTIKKNVLVIFFVNL